MKTNIRLPQLNKLNLGKKQMNLITGGSVAPGTCDGCLCNSDVSGQHENNSSKAATSGS